MFDLILAGGFLIAGACVGGFFVYIFCCKKRRVVTTPGVVISPPPGDICSMTYLGWVSDMTSWQIISGESNPAYIQDNNQYGQPQTVWTNHQKPYLPPLNQEANPPPPYQYSWLKTFLYIYFYWLKSSRVGSPSRFLYPNIILTNEDPVLIWPYKKHWTLYPRSVTSNLPCPVLSPALSSASISWCHAWCHDVSIRHWYQPWEHWSVTS